MEPLIRRPPSSAATSSAITGNIPPNASSHTVKTHGKNRQDDQEQDAGRLPLAERTTPMQGASSGRRDSELASGGSWQLFRQLPPHEMALIIMTPAVAAGHPAPLSMSSCCRLNPELERPSRRPDETLRADCSAAEESLSGYDKSNIINNNNINNRNSRKLKQTNKRKHAWRSNNSAPVLDRPETMRRGRRRRSRSLALTAAAAAAPEIETTTAAASQSHRRPAAAALGPLVGRCCSSGPTTKANAKAGSFMASCWSLTILILIAYELYLQALNILSSTSLSCQRCLPESVVFIRTCAAADLLAAAHNNVRADETTLSTMLPLEKELIQATAAAEASTELSSLQRQTFKTSSSTIISDRAANNDTISSAAPAGGSTAPRPAVSTNAINKHHNNVLCNSRCNCVILEPFHAAAPASVAAAARNSSQPDQAAGAMTGSGGGPSSQRPPGGSASLLTTTAAANIDQQQTNSVTQASVNENSSRNFQQQEHQFRIEQALNAFSEDYSVDYEQQSAASGNGAPPADDAGGVDVPDSAASGNDRAPAPSRPPAADQSNAAAASVRPQHGSGAGTSSGARAANATGGPTADAANPDNAGADNNGTTSPEPAGGAPQPQQVTGGPMSGSSVAPAPQSLRVNQSGDNSSYTNNEINGSNSKSPAGPDARVVGSRQRQLQQPATKVAASQLDAAAAASAQQQQQPQQAAGKLPPPIAQLTPLFPLPTRLHHHHRNHYQPLGPGSGGRESSGPQLYAQSLYSSQAPKLSYHAHAPYLKSSSAGQQQPAAASYAASDPASAQQQAGSAPGMAAPPFGGHQYHHLRSSYLAHHQRQQMAMSGAAAGGKRPLLSSSVVSASIQRLVPLRALDLSNKLNWNTTTSGAPNSTTIPDWTKSAQFAEQVRSVLSDVESADVQSLILRDNDIQFELWSELYALLAPSMRRHIYHLDMSHNSLAKLGITFTGYIEHHLAAHGSWPFNGPQSAPATNRSSTASEIGAAGGQQQPGPGSKPGGSPGGRLKHTLLSGGKLYTMVRRILEQQASNATAASNASTILFQQPMLLRALDLSHNKLKWLINDQFRALKHVQTIRLDYNRIRYINQHAFSGLEALRFLNLNFNRLQVIYIEQFQTNYNLLALMLRANYLAYLRGGSFASLANLRRLDLSRNKLTIMSNNAFVGLESLEMLNCSSNQFVHAPSASLHSLTSVRQLDLSDNLITQLSPGAFFHLPIEELWLNQNEQLVAIDRGAFWDLPYLRQLHLKWNPMLMSINSQAFVGTQSLQSIDVAGCQSLEPGTRQMLDNITMAATSRLLRYEQSRLNHSSQVTASGQPAPPEAAATGQEQHQQKGTANTSTLPLDLHHPQQPAPPLVGANKLAAGAVPASHGHIKRPSEQPGGYSALKYAYCLAIVGLLVVALKLIFAYTSRSHYADARRRRRRIYASKTACQDMGQLDDDGSSQSMSSSSGSDAFPMCVQPDDFVIAGSRRCNLQADAAGSPYEGGSEQVAATAAASAATATADNNDDEAENNDISVISDSAYCLGWPAASGPQQRVGAGPNEGDESSDLCYESNPQVAPLPEVAPVTSDESGQASEQPMQHQVVGDLQQQQQQSQQSSSSTIDLIHSQLIAAGFDYGHANCAHFYQSLGPALQLADMTANFVNSMDYY